jgi:hypothetical protein
MVKKIIVVTLSVIGLLVLIFLIAAALQPDRFTISRSIEINSPPSKPFGLVNDFHQWQHWSPFEKLDPNLKRTFEGADAGEGAVYKWEGNSDAGQGKMTINESKPDERLLIQLDFIQPMEATAEARFDFVPAGDRTKVTWTMSGENSFVGKAMGLLVNMDKMIGKSFEEGLGKLKEVSESKNAEAAAESTETPLPAEPAPPTAEPAKP